MSIVITVVTPYAVVQVSDMQLTAFSDGTVSSGQQRKSLVLVGTQVVCVAGWVGLATIGSHNTGTWLHGQLDAMNAVVLDVQTIAKTLADSATLHFALLPKVDKRCSFAVGGWFVTSTGTVEPFFCRITNWDFIQSPRPSSETSVKFEYNFALRNPKRSSKHLYLMHAMGDDKTAMELQPHFHGLRGLLKRRANISVISSACRQIALAIAAKQDKKKEADPAYVKTVGKNLLALEMDESTVQSRYFPENSTSVVLVADILSPATVAKDVVTESRVNAEGQTEVTLRGWFKWNSLK